MEHSTAVEYASEHTFTSETMPGVTYTLHFGSYARRLRLHDMTAEFRSKMRLISRDRDRALEQVNEEKAAFEKMRAEEIAELEQAIKNEEDDSIALDMQKRIDALRETEFPYPPEAVEAAKEIGRQSDEAVARLYNPARLRVYLKSTNLTINGQPATVESLLEEGHPFLVAEILDRIDTVQGLTPEQQKNLLSPSTSPAAMDGETNDTTAAAAE